MITGFEEITKPLNEEEQHYVEVLIKAFSTMKKGKDHAITSTFIIDKLKSINVDVEGVRLRKLIQHIRVNNLVYGLCSNSNGYFMSENAEELLSTLKSLKDRIEMQTSTFKALKYQYDFMYNHKEDEIKDENKLF